MRVSTRVEYGVLALVDIALNSTGAGSVSAIEISERQGISKKYLEQILPLLKQAGLIRAHKGLGGGYSLCCNADSIKMSDVINALDNSILEQMEYEEGDSYKELSRAINKCLWRPINNQMRSFTEGMSLSEFSQKCGNQMTNGWDMYII